MKIPAHRQSEERSSVLRRFATPYSWQETLGIIVRNFRGVDAKRNAGIIQAAPRDVILHEGDQPFLTVGFLGDIMNLDAKTLIFSPAVKSWAASCDLMVGNFEATIHDTKDRAGVLWGLEQPQTERIIGHMTELFEPSRFFLGLANNHSGDFARSVFERSCGLLSSAGFPLFGMANMPTIDIHEDVRIVAGTMWSNQHADDMLYLHNPDDAPAYRREGAINVLYAHWGYELEAWPRKFIAKLGREFAEQYDAVIAHHSHNPQPLAIENGVPVAYGLGGFCFYYNLPTYTDGMVVQLVIGRPQGGGAARVSSVHWTPIVNRHTDNSVTVEVDQQPRPWLLPVSQNPL